MALTTNRLNSSPSPTYTSSRTPNDTSRCTRTAGKAGKSTGWATADPARRAVTIDQAAELLGVPLREVKRAARQVDPYRHHDGSPRWPLRELARVLADCGGVVSPDLDPFLPRADRRKQFRDARR